MGDDKQQRMMIIINIMPMGSDYMSELRPPTDQQSPQQVIYVIYEQQNHGTMIWKGENS
jgi:hypothetical protein